VGDKGGLATSRDLIHWEKYHGNPVFPLDQPGAWDDGHVRPKGVAKFRGWYYMFYEGAHNDGRVWFDQVGMARSKDLIHWERFPLNPIIPLDTASGRDTLVTEWPCAIVKDNRLYVLYWGGAPGNVAISLAEIPTDVLDAWGKE
jgi:sucrose-6-phosphate hydrolase SacC (GH32 family)